MIINGRSNAFDNYYQNYALGIAIANKINLEIFNLLMTALVDRRYRLTNVAMKVLPSRICCALGCNKGHILDSYTEAVIRALDEAHMNIPTALVSQPEGLGTVYHLEGLTVEVANRLYSAGFRQVNEYDAHGLTPLMRCGLDSNRSTYSTLMHWLISKRANLGKIQWDDYGYAWLFVTHMISYQKSTLKHRACE